MTNDVGEKICVFCGTKMVFMEKGKYHKCPKCKHINKPSVNCSAAKTEARANW